MTKQLTRQEVEAVVEKFADKTLSFGCYVTVKDQGEWCSTPFVVVNFNNKYGYIDTVYKDQSVRSDIYEIIGHHVTIGNVLEKMQGEGDEKLSILGMEFDIIELVQLWQPLGLSRSLQEIVQASGWEYTLTARDEDSSIRKAEVLTSPEANALFSFLQEIL